MGAFFIYILKSSVCLVLFYLFFRVLLSKETFHRFNRVALLGVLFLSLLIPFIEVTTNHQVEVQQTMLTIEQVLLMAEMEPATVDATGGVAVYEVASLSWIEILLLVYLAGIIFFACRNLYSLIRLFRLIHSGKREKLENGTTLVVHEQEIAPFSWMKYIVISRKDLEENGMISSSFAISESPGSRPDFAVRVSRALRTRSPSSFMDRLTRIIPSSRRKRRISPAIIGTA